MKQNQFIESIRFEDGKFHLLDLHQERINRTFAAFFPKRTPYNLATILPQFQGSGKFKFRILYDQKGYEVEHTFYQPKVINTVQLIEANDLDYSFKYAERTELIRLLEKSGSDEIIIIKNGLITDSSYANLACFDGTIWWTPEQPLLAGVRRESLLRQGIIKSTQISANQLQSFERICLINAMLDLEELNLDVSIVD